MHHTSIILEQENSPFVLTATLLESAIKKQLNHGKMVKGFIFCNPNNPLGEIYGPDLTIQLMKVCAKYEIHFIVDEIYALSVHNHECEDSFQSVLTIPQKQVKNKQRRSRSHNSIQCSSQILRGHIYCGGSVRIWVSPASGWALSTRTTR